MALSDDVIGPGVSAVEPDKFEKVFGPDVHFKRMWVETTSDAVTRVTSTKSAVVGTPGCLPLEAYRGWREGNTVGTSPGPERLFRRSF